MKEMTRRAADDFVQAGEKTISELARAYGISLRTLRFYEDRGLLQPRRQGTARLYSEQDRIRLELILKGKRLGFTLSEINELIDSRSPSTGADTADIAVSLDRDKIAAQIAYLQRQRDELDEAITELQGAYQRMLEPVR